MKKLSGVHEIKLIVGLALTGLLCAAFAGKDLRREILLKGAGDGKAAPLVLQALDYTENPVDIPNPTGASIEADGSLRRHLLVLHLK